MRALLIALPLTLLAMPAFAQQPGVPAPEAAAAAPTGAEPRVNQLIIYGEDPCPPGNNDEIIVCARLPEGDRFRIPPNLRDNPNDPANNSWANRALELSYAGRTGTDSCSTVGGGGFTGCFNQLVRQARAERAGRDEVNWNQLIEAARRERMRRIDNAEVEDLEAERDQQVPPRTPQ
jgi:hypothetical protein